MIRKIVSSVTAGCVVLFFVQTVLAYPIDGYPQSGIRRLERLCDILRRDCDFRERIRRVLVSRAQRLPGCLTRAAVDRERRGRR